MSAPPPPTRRTWRRRVQWLLYVLASLTALLLLLSVAALLILPSEWFREKVRTRMIYEIERASGGRAEIGAFRFDWTTLTAEVAPFVLHGTEPAHEDPLFRAESVQVQFKIISMLRRDIDVAAVTVEQPRLNLLVDSAGITNFPKPKVQRTSKHPIETLVDVAIGEITIRNGSVRYGDRRLKLDVHGRYLNASLAYDFTNPSYRGRVRVAELTVDRKPALPLTAGFDAAVALFRNHLQIDRAVMSMTDSFVEASGRIADFRHPNVALTVRADTSVAQVGTALRLPKPHTGRLIFNGSLVYGPETPLRLAGRITGQHLAIEQERVRIQAISLASDVDLTAEKVSLRDTTVHALDGVFRGMVDIFDFKTYKVNGVLTGVSIRSLTRMAGLRESNLAGTMNGPVEVTGAFDNPLRTLRAGGRFDVAASQEGVPVQGRLEVSFNGRTRSVELGRSHLTLPHSRLDFDGTLGASLRVRAESTGLEDFLPTLALATDTPPKDLPVRLLVGGRAHFEGVVSGPLDAARATGKVRITLAEAAGQKLDAVSADVAVSRSELALRGLAVQQAATRLTGQIAVSLQNWRILDSSSLAGGFQLANASLSKLVADAGYKLPVAGTLHAGVQLSGATGSPEAALKVQLDRPSLYGEQFDRVTAEIRYAGRGIEVIHGVAAAGPSRILLSGAYTHPPKDWANGQLRFDLATQAWTLQSIRNLHKQQPGLGGQFELKARGVLDVRGGELRPATLDGALDLKRVEKDGRPVGDFHIDARTSGRQMALSLAGHVRGAKLSGTSRVDLAGDYPASGEISFAPVAFSVLQDLLRGAGSQRAPFDGYVAGRATFEGPLRKPERVRASIELPTLQVVPARRTMTARQIAELALRNESPVRIDYDGKSLTVKNAHMVGRDTNIQVSGAVGLAERAAWDLRVNGTLNLAVLQDFNQDLVSSGAAVINASVKGSLRDPNVTGRMELRKASFYLADFPNGLDDANGIIIFDQRRANIEKMTAVTGGGTISLSGFVGFAGELVYRLQARGDSVRIRYPEGVSTTANATLTLTGSSSKSLLSGVVTIVRASFNPRTDIGGLLATAPAPVASPATQSEFLRNMQFDVRVETVPNLQFQTTLTTDLQAEADLRVRGTAFKPVVLGRILISQGEIQFFGNKYTINRGEIGFFNPVRVEPVIDMDLETRVRGVLVNINFNGPLQKLNVSYRSDPPLQSTEIVALLAVGRAPGSNSSLAAGQTVSSQGIFSSSTNSLLGQAVAAPISGRLQRFFGVSRLKIDPQLTGLSAVPQARLTIEQQISRDVTLTYVTNLSQANQQIIRLEWDLSRNWSVVAVREENGVFGVDFFFKRRFR